MKTLILIDIQNDFMPGGNLPVPYGDSIIPYIHQIMPNYHLIVATQDWHPPHHHSLASQHPGKKPFESIAWRDTQQTLWPDHCIQGTWGAALHPDLNCNPIQAIFRKGMNPEMDSYSAFFENDHITTTGLSAYLQAMGADDLYFCGLCQEICVAYSIADALQLGFRCTLLEQGCCILEASAWEKIKPSLIHQGLNIL